MEVFLCVGFVPKYERIGREWYFSDKGLENFCKDVSSAINKFEDHRWYNVTVSFSDQNESFFFLNSYPNTPALRAKAYDSFRKAKKLSLGKSIEGEPFLTQSKCVKKGNFDFFIYNKAFERNLLKFLEKEIS